ncbi:efflux transporter outer membrane subunit [Solitalea canadensis]|uniref:Efflux transporter, outer membrane factor lipoprotein, NodT family n=1 Tax=Solitalea canadensis (strain ATCC 29591 / DSM 3403 / JCM 21819 / LMG 8368 / NBRC 15130 / NCIMB 12057 / USAM 9D) TaxID=929556 RepID=H8KM23_SOLCM|nr:efflux transporter outer membrane subunit [Solitalea canadensis]AFD08945.1 efflux transporter, outer membrane factor lipoprotein, NodT family [Solitalea canadensis DSM 3403]
MMKNKFQLGVALLALSASFNACRVSEKYARPDQKMPEQYRDYTSSADTSSSIGKLEWRTLFKDEELVSLIDSAIHNNINLQLAVKNIESAERLLSQAKMGNIPELSAQIAASITRPSDNSLNGISAGQFLGSKYVKDYQATLNLSWEADIWGKIRSQKESALATYLQSQEAAKAVQTQVVAAVAQGYYNLLMLDEQLRIAKNNVELNDSTLFIIRLQRDAGQATTLAVQQAEAQRLNSAILIPQLEQSIAIQENALSFLTGEMPKVITRRQNLYRVDLPTEYNSGVPALLLSNRPDVKSSELALVSANARVGVTKAALYPSLTITATGGLNAFEASNWFNIPGSLFATAAGSVAQPIFMRKQLRTQYELAKIDRDRFALDFRQSVLIAVGEVSDALVRIDKIQEQETIERTRVDTLKSAIVNAKLLFNSGMADYLEVLIAQGSALQGELNLADIQRQRLALAVELYRSLGGGWK